MTKLRIIVAEDEPLIRFDIKETLEEEGHQVVGEASDGKEALALVEHLKPDLVILDVKMPKVDGLTVATEIAERKSAPVLILTAYSQKDFLKKAADAGVLAYLVKPFKKEDLLSGVEIARARFEQFSLLDKEVGDLQSKLETRRLVDRAKGILMHEYGFSEPEAFRSLQKLAMDKQKPVKEICLAVIATEKGENKV